MKKILLFVVSIFIFTFSSSKGQYSSSFKYPLQDNWNVTQDFNVWNRSFSGYHLGEDVVRNSEAAVNAAADGKVMHVAKHTGYGYVIIIQHQLPDNSIVCSVYGHLRVKDITVSGIDVKKGELIGYLSSDPNENGGYNFTHLHFGIRSGVYSTNLDIDGNWRYRGYGPSNIVSLWYDPSDFIKKYSSTPSLTVTNPLKDYTWNYNSKVKVEWEYSGFTGNVAVDIYKGSTNQIRIVSSVPVTQKYVEFVLPTSLIPGGDYRIGISETPTGNPAAFSDTFSIRKLTVTYPNGGQTFNSGQIVNVKWSYDFVTDNISIDLYKGDSNSTRLISSTPVKDGNKDVTIPIGISSGSDYRIAISAHGGYVWDFSDNHFTISPSSNSTAILDELDGSTLGNPFGVTYANTPHNQGAVFSRANESRIEYPFSMGLSHEGTVEMQIKVDKGYTYSDYVLQDNQSYAIIFNTGPSDVWYLGAMWLAVDNSGGVSLATALTAGPTSHSLSASSTTFRFNEWHIVSFSYGSQGQYLKVDGQLVASNLSYTETLQTCGDWSSKRDIPTVGEIKSVFWGNNQYDQGFEGTLDRFRASNAQQDWALNVTDVKDAYDNLPQNYSLSQNYPNPFNPSSIIRYDLPKEGMVSIKIYDMLGREVKTLVNEYKSVGSYNIEFNANNLTSGIYFYHLQTSDFSQTKKLILMK